MSPSHRPATLFRSAVVAFLLAVILLALAFPVHAAPPSYADRDHVFNGCHLSSLAYLAKFKVAFPAERGDTVRIIRTEASGRRGGHTVAVVTWEGKWWCRDEFIGTFPLERTVAATPDAEKLAGRVTDLLARWTARFDASGRATVLDVPDFVSADRRLSEITRARRILPIASTTYWVRSGNTEMPVVFFRPAAGWVAVYDPIRGTGAAETTATDDAGIVALVASRMGYHVDSVRLDSASTPAVAASTIAALTR